VTKSRRVRGEGHVVHMRGMRYVHKILRGKPEGKKKLARPRYRKEKKI
jgi:hypothetical protein